MMKAVYIKEFVKSLDEVKSSTVPIPSPPQNTRRPHYLVRITHVSPTHVDTLYARGLHQNNNRERGFVHPPFILGTEFAGIIETRYPASTPASSHADHARFMQGDRVWGASLGAFATYTVAAESSLRLVPTSLSLRDAAALGATTTPVSYGALLRIAKLQEGETCLVHAAAGGLGVVAVQIALAVGARVIGTVSSDAKAEVIKKLLCNASKSGKDVPSGSGVVRYDQPEWEERVKQISGGRGVDVVFDTVGLVEKSIRCCAFNARVVIIGFVGRGGQMEKVAMNRVLLKQIQLLGYRYGETSRRTPQETVETLAELDKLLNGGDIQPVVYKDFVGLDMMPRALQMMTTREVAGKIVVAVDGEGEGEDHTNGSGNDEAEQADGQTDQKRSRARL